MKIIIAEHKDGKGNLYYEKSYIQESGELKFGMVVNIKAVAIKDKENKATFIIYNSRREVISSAYRFINIDLKDCSPNTIDTYVRALKILHSYMELISIDINRFTNNQCKLFIDFLYGLDLRGRTKFENLTKKSADTINIYLAIYRRYMTYLNIEGSPLFNKRNRGFVKGSTGLLAHTQKEKVSSYTFNQKTINSIEVPKYVDIEEFKKIIKHVRENYSLREEIILRLMFEK